MRFRTRQVWGLSLVLSFTGGQAGVGAGVYARESWSEAVSNGQITAAQGREMERVDREFCVAACQSAVNSLQWGDLGSDDDDNNDDGAASSSGVSAVCGSRSAARSYLLCVKNYCPASTRPQHEAVNATCRAETGGKGLPMWMELREPGGGETWKPVDGDDRGDVQGRPVLVTEPYYYLWAATLDATKYVYTLHTYYGWAMGIYWGIIVLLTMLFRDIGRAGWGTARLTDSKPSVWYRRYLSLPMTFGAKHGRDVGWATIPARNQGVAVAAFVVLNVVLSCVGYKFVNGNMYYPTITSQVLRYVSDRTGIISLANFPLIWLFGTRNNVVSWLTGWDFPECTQFHRWVGRVAAVQAVVHSIGYTILVFREGGMDRFLWWWTWQFWWAGELATVFLCALVALSFYWVRSKHYETFLVSHIVLSAFILITMLMHVAIFDGTYDPLIYVPAGIWVADRILRGARIVAFNPKFWATEAQATFDAAANIVRLEIPLTNSLYTPPPGSYHYLMVMDKTFWQSHPFTIGGVSPDGKALGEVGSSDPLLQGGSEDDAADDTIPSEAEKPRVATILVRPYDQFTARLRDLSSEKESSPSSIRVLVEGPYGHTQPLHEFERVVFITGGSGIAVALSYLSLLTGKKSKVSNVEIHWGVREAAFAEQVVLRDCRRRVLDDDRFEMIVYMSLDGRGPQTSLDARPGVELRTSRMDCGAQIERAVQDSEGGRVAVVCCGPGEMATEAREAVSKALGEGGRVEYFEESYKW